MHDKSAYVKHAWNIDIGNTFQYIYILIIVIRQKVG